MAKNSADGNKARTARYRAGLAARGIRPVQLYAPEEAHPLLRQAVRLMTCEHNPLEARRALRQASGANDAEEEGNGPNKERNLTAEVEAVRADLAVAREAGRRAEQTALAQAEAAEAEARRANNAEQGREAAEAAAARARAEVERFQSMPGLRGRAIRWLAR